MHPEFHRIRTGQSVVRLWNEVDPSSNVSRLSQSCLVSGVITVRTISSIQQEVLDTADFTGALVEPQDSVTARVNNQILVLAANICLRWANESPSLHDRRIRIAHGLVGRVRCPLRKAGSIRFDDTAFVSNHRNPLLDPVYSDIGPCSNRTVSANNAARHII